MPCRGSGTRGVRPSSACLRLPVAGVGVVALRAGNTQQLRRTASHRAVGVADASPWGQSDSLLVFLLAQARQTLALIARGGPFQVPAR